MSPAANGTDQPSPLFASQGVKQRHSRIATTMDIYAQHVPESQRQAVAKMMDMIVERRARVEQAQSASIN